MGTRDNKLVLEEKIVCKYIPIAELDLRTGDIRSSPEEARRGRGESLKNNRYTKSMLRTASKPRPKNIYQDLAILRI